KGENIFYTSTEGSPVNRQFYKVTIKDGTKAQLTFLNGVHTETFNDNGEYFLDNFSSLEVPRSITLISNTGVVSKVLLIADNPLKDYQLGKMKIFPLFTPKGDTLYCRMYAPTDFDPNKKYPVIDYMYGGPGVQLVTNTFPTGNDVWYQYMAEHGFLIFTLDNRGSADRGKAFEQATFRKLGT